MSISLLSPTSPTAKTTFRDLPQDQARVLEVIDNPVEIDTYSTGINTTRVRPTSIVNPADSYEYVIITNSDLKSSFPPLADWKNQTGVNTTIITVNQITSEPGYSGTDTQAEIRNSIFDAYNNWEIGVQ